ncbi:MAG TPA: hypothetical protein DD390_00340 [Rhodospirillaceae bacterium]|nr:hypothetical protein [Rhodospirillaceae bacterium]MAX61915.1 hypothetical protein [Rhodospirillaceae bacterium]MAX63251.1 hypothetical protein [Rhodospirillaceae bacterium]HBM11121.1 hypothetical protein [Rhodospirillaceae bacterium]
MSIDRPWRPVVYPIVLGLLMIMLVAFLFPELLWVRDPACQTLPVSEQPLCEALKGGDGS